MRRIFLKLFFTVITVAAFLPASAQTCTGSLGDPIKTENFGSGAANPSPELPPGATTYKFSENTCPDDGFYSIVNATSGCFQNTWITVSSDHTGNPNGYMMIVNASNDPGVFYTESFTGLCPNTTYEFAAWILNLMVPSACGGAPIKPNITFSIEQDNLPARTYNTGDIPASGKVNWVQYGTYFTTGPNVSTVTVKMTNNAPGGCGNDLVLDDITFRACGPTISAGFNDVSSSSDQPLCDGDMATYTLKTSITPADIYTQPAYQWQSNNGNGWQDMPGKTSATLNIAFQPAVVGTYQYRLGAADGTNINSPNCRVYSQPLTVNVYPNPVITGIALTQPPVCEGNTLSILASGGATYKWTGPNDFTSAQNPLVINNIKSSDAGDYTVTAYSQYCQSQPFTTSVSVIPKPTAKATGNTTICSGDHTQLGASGGASYSWSPGKTLSDSTVANPVASPTDTTTYKVTVTDASGCSDTASVTVNVLKNPVASAGSNKVIFEGQSVRLTATAEYSNVFSWTPATGLSDPNILNPIASPTDDITYTLHATSTQNCGTASSSVFVKVYKKITIPTSFSPNNDGINDYWNIDALVTYPQCILTVFNRYGQQVFRSVGYGKPWNGKYNGQPLPDGTYYYILDLKNNTPKMSGWVVIVR